MILRLATHACGTRFELVLAGAEPAGSRLGRAERCPRVSQTERLLRAAGEEALAAIAEVDRTFSLFRRDSLLARINARAGVEPVRLDAEAYELLDEALAIWRASAGAFDPALAPRMHALGFHADSALGAAPPDVEAPGAASIALDSQARSIRFASAAVALDLGAIAKGHALDLAVERLREAGVERALLHGGSSTVYALGAPPDEAGWRIALEARDGPSVLLADGALALSASRGRVDEDGNGHVLDPRTGGSAPADRAALVLSPSARTADAWATALVVQPDLLERRAWPAATCAGTACGIPSERAWRFAGDPHVRARVTAAGAATDSRANDLQRVRADASDAVLN